MTGALPHGKLAQEQCEKLYRPARHDLAVKPQYKLKEKDEDSEQNEQMLGLIVFLAARTNVLTEIRQRLVDFVMFQPIFVFH